MDLTLDEYLNRIDQWKAGAADRIAGLVPEPAVEVASRAERAMVAAGRSPSPTPPSRPRALPEIARAE